MPSNDDLDDILRAAMKTLDDEVPSGYFEALPNRTLARLEGSMQTTSGTESSNSEMPMTTDGTGKQRSEDSGLHDIRSLASSQRQRLSSRRLGTNPPPVDEDILASTSGSWKSIALPEPAKMVALPDIAELPSKADLKAQQKADKAAAKAEAKARKSRPSGEIKSEIKNDELPMAAASSLPSMPKHDAVSSDLGGGGLAVATSAKVSEAPLHLEEELPSLALGTAKGDMAIGTAKGATSVAAPQMMIGSRIAGVQPKKNRAALFGALGLGLAAAAGAIIYVATRDKGADTVNTSAVADDRAGVAAEPAKPAAVAAPDPAPVAPDVEPKVDDAKDAKAVDEPEPAIPDEPAKAPAKPTKPTTKKPVTKQVIEVDDPGTGVKPKKEEPKPLEKKEPAKEGDPDFEQLLKESGYQEKKNDKPKLEKKSLSGPDFKTGMAGVAARAQGCYKGTQGTALVKLTIAPSGQVSKVVVSGVGAAEKSCVESAVRAAKFPPWDGGPQSFGYSYLLSE